MAKVKVIDKAREIYWATTAQGKFEVDGEVVEFRYHENSDGAEFYVRTENGWEEVDCEEKEEWRTVYYLCLESPADELGEEGDEFEFNADDML